MSLWKIATVAETFTTSVRLFEATGSGPRCHGRNGGVCLGGRHIPFESLGCDMIRRSTMVACGSRRESVSCF